MGGDVWGCFFRVPINCAKNLILMGTFLLQDRVFTGYVPINDALLPKVHDMMMKMANLITISSPKDVAGF